MFWICAVHHWIPFGAEYNNPNKGEPWLRVMRGANWSHCFWGRGYDKQGEWGERRKWWRPTLSRLYILLSFKVLIYIASLKQKNIKNSNKPATYRYFLKNRNKLTNTSYGIGKSSTGLTYLTTSTSIHSAPCQQLLGHVIQHRKSLSEFTLYFKKVMKHL